MWAPERLTSWIDAPAHPQGDHLTHDRMCKADLRPPGRMNQAIQVRTRWVSRDGRELTDVTPDPLVMMVSPAPRTTAAGITPTPSGVGGPRSRRARRRYHTNGPAQISGAKSHRNVVYDIPTTSLVR